MLARAVLLAVTRFPTPGSSSTPGQERFLTSPAHSCFLERNFRKHSLVAVKNEKVLVGVALALPAAVCVAFRAGPRLPGHGELPQSGRGQSCLHFSAHGGV